MDEHGRIHNPSRRAGMDRVGSRDPFASWVRTPSRVMEDWYGGPIGDLHGGGKYMLDVLKTVIDAVAERDRRGTFRPARRGDRDGGRIDRRGPAL